MIRRIIIFVFLFISTAVSLFAAPVQQAFKEANQLYADGKFKEAIEAYEKIRQEKLLAEIYYNFGNAYFKNKQLGLAVLNYEKAKKMSPRDLDVRNNLDYTSRLIEYKVEDKRSWYVRAISKLLSYFTFAELWFAFLTSYFLLVVRLLISILRKKHLVFGGLTVTLILLSVVCFAPLGLKYMESGMDGEAVVISKQAEVRYGPSTVDQIAFRLVEGLKISIRDHKQDWYRIHIEDGRTGWVSADNIQLI